MEDNVKKPIMIGVIVVCFVLVGFIAYNSISGSPSGVESLKRGTLIWLKCLKCEAAYQMDEKDYYEFLEKHKMDGVVMSCDKCGEGNVLRAAKCDKCGVIFFMSGALDDYKDRCPKCGYSATEEKRTGASRGPGE
jgi:predicted Zn-ribbon and HTH transcriptional regulator